MEYSSVFEIIRAHTFYHNDKHRCYLSLHNLLMLFQLIDTEVKNYDIELPKFIRVIPHYDNMKLNIHYQRIELDEYMLYIECRDVVNMEMKNKFLDSCWNEEDFWELKTSHVQKICINIIEKSAHIQFLNILREYYDFIVNTLVPKIYSKIKKLTNASDNEMCIGEFSFEIHCG